MHYPGLADHPGHAVAARQMQAFGGMLSVQVQGGRAAAIRVAARVRLFTRATSLGSVESLIEHRASIEGAHSTTPDNLLRVSIGLEHTDDLIADLAQALSPQHDDRLNRCRIGRPMQPRWARLVIVHALTPLLPEALDPARHGFGANAIDTCCRGHRQSPLNHRQSLLISTWRRQRRTVIDFSLAALLGNLYVVVQTSPIRPAWTSY